MVAQWAADRSGRDMLDNGDLATLESNFAVAIRAQKDNYAAPASVGGTANAITLTFTPAFTTLASMAFVPMRFLALAANIGPVTINVNGLGAVPLTWPDATAYVAGDIPAAGYIVECMYDGTAFRGLVELSPTQVRAIAMTRQRAQYTTVGSYTWTNPYSYPIKATIKLWGAGGGAGAANTPSGSAGGGAGGYLEKVVSVPGGGTISGNIGAGGAGGVPASSAAVGGGSTTATITGDATVYTAAGGAASGSIGGGAGAGNSAAGGTTTNGDLPSRWGEPSAGAVQGYSGSGTLYYGGKGGASPSGGYGGMSGTGGGNPGSAPGGGGGGSGANGTSQTGGAGARGEAWIEY